MENPILGIDTWEGQLEIDESILKANDVKFMFIRLNDMNGGHHKDTGFDKQWKEAQGFYRAPYFVYNPWVTGQQNYDWLAANMPPDALAVAADVEVKKDGYLPAAYAVEFDKFTTLCKKRWNYVIYTGEWFLSYLSYWRVDCLYWWAQYPNEFYTAQTLTWNQLREKLLPYSKPFNVSKIPGTLLAWQFTGDKLTLPGNSRSMDVNIFYGDLGAFFGGTPPPVDDVISTPYDGMTTITGERYGWKFTIDLFDKSKVNFGIVDALNNLETVSSMTKRAGANVGYNGSEWDKYAVPPVIVTTPYAPRLSIRDNNPAIDETTKPPHVIGLRYLVKDGIVQSYLYGTLPQYTEGHARTCYGLHSDGRVMVFVSEGLYPNQGLLLWQVAELMKQYGCIVSFDAGGGGDVTRVLDGVVTNRLQDGAERAIPQAFTVRTKELGETMKYTANALDSTRIRPDHNTNNTAIATVPAGTLLNGDVLFTAPVDLYNSFGVKYQMVGDQWLQIGEGIYTGKWIAVIHMGGTICTLTENPTEPPPPLPGKHVSVTVELDGYKPKTLEGDLEPE